MVRKLEGLSCFSPSESPPAHIGLNSTSSFDIANLQEACDMRATVVRFGFRHASKEAKLLYGFRHASKEAKL